MYPQSLSLPSPHFTHGFAERTALPRRTVCAGGKPYHVDPNTGQPFCFCQLPASSSLAMSGPAAHNSPNNSPVSVHLPPFTAARAGLHEHFGGVGLGKDHTSTRSIPLGGPYTPAALAAYHPYLYAGYEIGGIRKAAVRETTGPLKAWLHEHKKNPYPTKAEKVMLAIITQMTLTQVSTWFANARRRLKKESRGSWEGGVDHDDDKDDVEDKDEDSINTDQYENLSDVSVDGEDNVVRANNVSSEATAACPDSRLVHPPHSLPQRGFLPLPPPHHHQHHLQPLFVPPLQPPLCSSTLLQSGPPVKLEVPHTSRDGENRGGRYSEAVAPPTPKPRIWSISAIIGLDKEDKNANDSDNYEDKAAKISVSDSGSSSSNNTVTGSVQHVESDSTDRGVCSEAASHRGPVSSMPVCSPRPASPQSSPTH